MCACSQLMVEDIMRFRGYQFFLQKMYLVTIIRNERHYLLMINLVRTAVGFSGVKQKHLSITINLTGRLITEGGHMTYDDLNNVEPKMIGNTTLNKKSAEITLRTNTSAGEMTPINRVPISFRKNGLTYIMKTRNAKVALYELFLNGQSVGYEVCVLKVLPKERILKRLYPEREALPSDEEFGMDGSKAFFPGELEKAKAYFDNMAALTNANTNCAR